MRKIFGGLLAVALLAWPNVVRAAAPNPVSGLTVSPAIEQLNLARDQTNISFTAQVTNNTAAPLLVDLSTNDFTALNQRGGITFFNTPLAENPHGLAAWIKPGLTQLALPPRASQTVPINITGVDSLAPGGHYGAIIYKVVASGSTALKNRISNNEEVSTLVFLSTFSGGTHAIRLDNVPVGSFAFSLPKTINAVFTNNGNTQTTPRGLVLLSGPDGTELARGIINIDSGLILPETSRLYTVNLKTEHKLVYPGIYHLSVIYQADNGSKAIIYTKSFIVINKSLLIAGLAILLLLVLILIRRVGPTKPTAWKIRPKL